MNKTMMAYNGDGGEVGMMTLERALERFESAVIENGCITVGDERAEEDADHVTIDGAEYHVTSRRNGGVYGHATKHCDESGCAGDERFLATASVR